MISFFYIILVPFCFFFILMPAFRFWSCIDRMNLMREVNRRAPSMLFSDIAMGIFALMPFVLAFFDWTGITLPRQQAPISSYAAVFAAVVCTGASAFIMSRSPERFAGHWAGARENVLRTIAALRIIDAAELAHALKYVQAREEQAKQGHIIDAQMREIQK